MRKDLDFEYRQITVRDAKGAQHRYTLLPASLVEPLQDHLIQVKRTHAEDLSKGYGAVYLPFALAEKYPNANREWIWQYVFPSHLLSPDEQIETRDASYTPNLSAKSKVWLILGGGILL